MRISKEKGFNSTIFECIETALKKLGESVAASILYQIEEKYKLPRQEFASRPLEMVKFLRTFLGPAGSAVVEKLIMKEIIASFDLTPSGQNSSLEWGIEEARKVFLTS